MLGSTRGRETRDPPGSFPTRKASRWMRTSEVAPGEDALQRIAESTRQSRRVFPPGIAQTGQGIIEAIGIGEWLRHPCNILAHPALRLFKGTPDDADQLDGQETGVVVPASRGSFAQRNMQPRGGITHAL